jgi:hypothetical protein
VVEHHLAKVRVAGSNPVFRSKETPRSGTLSRVPGCFSKPCLPIILPMACHFRATLKSVERLRRDAGGSNRSQWYEATLCVGLVQSVDFVEA